MTLQQAGAVLDERTTTEDIPDGQIPFTSIKRKSVNVGTSGTGGIYYAESSIAREAVGGDGTSKIDFVPIDGDAFDFDKISSVFDKQKEIVEETTGFFKKIFGEWDW